MPRIPLPVKLLLSYLCVLLIGAGPTFLYIRAVVLEDLMTDAALHLGDRCKRLGLALGTLPPDERVAWLTKVSELGTERITLMSPQGDVLFDNESPGARNESHAARPEVREALGDTSVPREPLVQKLPGLAGLGVSKRFSTTHGSELLYVAVRTSDAQGNLQGVLRLSTPVDRITDIASAWVRFVRNATAVALSAGIGFSLLAAVLFVRPLQRVGAMAQALGAGDLAAKVLKPGDDEVGDVARSLNSMATSLRRRLLDAGLGEALIAQLVEALPCSCVVFEEGGEAVALNGAARRTLHVAGPHAGQRMKELASHPAVMAAVVTAEQEGEPEPVSFELPEHGLVRGAVHVLKRPGTAPLRVFIGTAAMPDEPSLLPRVDQVVARPLEGVLEQAELRARTALDRAGVKLEIARPIHGVRVADAEERLVRAVSETLIWCARQCEDMGEVGATLFLDVVDEPTRVRLHLDLELRHEAVVALRPLLEPLGGEIVVSAAETDLWLPRA